MADDAKAEAANQKADEAEETEESEEDSGEGGFGGGGGKLPLILGIVNTLVVLGAIGTL